MQFTYKHLKRTVIALGVCALCFIPGRVLAQEEDQLHIQAEEALEVSSDINEKLARLTQAVEQAQEEEARRQAEAERLAKRRKEAFAEGSVNGAAYFNQTDSDYRNYPFASSNVYMAGCGPFSTAMAVSTLKGEVLDPLEFVDYANDKGYAISGVGISWGYFSSVASNYGLEVTQTSNPDAAIEALEEGSVVLMSQSSALGGYWTNGGHIVLLVGQNEDGDFLVNDPASRRRTSQTHSYEQVFTPNKMMWIMSVE